MMNNLIPAMKTSISEVMETMFFLPVEFLEETTFNHSGISEESFCAACSLKFQGDFSGTLLSVVPRELLIVMTQNFMGESRESLEEAHFLGTFKEMVNMVCGNTLKKIDSKIPFSMGIPEMMNFSEIPATHFFTRIETTEHQMAVTIILDE